jgi:hypothetical protein
MIKSHEPRYYDRIAKLLKEMNEFKYLIDIIPLICHYLPTNQHLLLMTKPDRIDNIGMSMLSLSPVNGTTRILIPNGSRAWRIARYFAILRQPRRHHDPSSHHELTSGSQDNNSWDDNGVLYDDVVYARARPVTDKPVCLLTANLTTGMSLLYAYPLGMSQLSGCFASSPLPLVVQVKQHQRIVSF